MKQVTPRIILPPVIRILRDQANQSIRVDHSELYLYFVNFILPYHEEWDVQVHCEYGANYGDCWGIRDAFPRDRDSFPLSIIIYDEQKTKLTEKTVTIKLSDRSVGQEPYRVLFFGDSMTRAAQYVTHAATRLYNLQTIGTRTYNGMIYIEGRGGWSMASYCTHRQATPACACSPFMFPRNIAGEDYYGDLVYWSEIKNPVHNGYEYDGYRYEEIRQGQYFLSDGKLYQQMVDDAVMVEQEPVFEFSFSKYIARHKIGKVDAVSVLMGANDLSHCTYEELDEKLEKYIQYLHMFVNSVLENDAETAIIINLPVLGAEQYAWGDKVGCRTTAKNYNYNMQHAAMAIIREFGDRESQGIYLCPMQAILDPASSHFHVQYHPNMYTDRFCEAQTDWVHPNYIGYCQMGDALAAVLEDIRQQTK